jgi:hypothetical protein
VTERTILRERVQELIQSAADNGYYDYDAGMDAAALAEEMFDLTTALEGENVDAVAREISGLRLDGWRPTRTNGPKEPTSIYDHPAMKHRS